MTTKTTVNLKLPRVRWPTISNAAGLSIIAGLLVAILAVILRPTDRPATPDAIRLLMTAAPETARPAAQLAAVVTAPAPRAIVAFAAPDGAVLGAIPEPTMSAITGRYGDAWLSTLWQGGTVWVRSADLGMSLADARPVQIAPAQVVYVAAPEPTLDPAALISQPIVMTDAQRDAVDRQFGVTDEQRQAALAEHQARQAALTGPRPTAGPTGLTSADLPVNGPEATQTLPDALNAIRNDVQMGERWRSEHCIGSGAAEVCH